MPDVTEPIIGFRAWRVTCDGALVPWSAAAAGAWVPGINSAICLARPSTPSHRAPMRRCSCGIYALASADDRRLTHQNLAVGAIAAWGDIEVHTTGFRAEKAAIVALALDADVDPVHRRRLTLAAARYGVPLVPRAGLAAAAGEYGRRIDAGRVLRGSADEENREAAPPRGLVGMSGIAIAEHLHVTITEAGVRLSPTDLLASEIVGGSRGLHAVGDSVRRGDPVFEALGHGGSILVPSPLSGRVTAVSDAEFGTAGLELLPDDWELEAPDVSWGVGSRSEYLLEIAQAAHRGDPFLPLRSHWVRAHAHVRSAADVLAALRAARTAPGFASADDVYEQIGGCLRAALSDPAVARHALRAEIRILWRLHEPDADILLDLRSAGPAVIADPPDRHADLALFASATAADAYFRGSLDLPAALRRREIQSAAAWSAVLRAESILKVIKPGYAALCQSSSVRPR